MRNPKKEGIYKLWYELLHEDPAKRAQLRKQLNELFDEAAAMSNGRMSRQDIEDYLYSGFCDYRAARAREENAFRLGNKG